VGRSNSSHRISSWGAFSLLILTVALGSSPAASAATKVIPTVAEGAEGNDSYGLNFALTLQNLFAANQLNGLPAGATITGLQFRHDGSVPANPLMSATHFDVYLGPPTGATLGSTVAGNQGPGTVQVRSGAISFPAGAFPSGDSPNTFGPVVGFGTPFTYTGGPLLVTLSYTDFTGGTGLDFVSSGAPGNDLRQWLGYNGSTLDDSAPPASALVMQLDYTVPEPTSAGILATAGMVLLLRRRRRGTPCGGPKR
jgi:hypothetical protein